MLTTLLLSVAMTRAQLLLAVERAPAPVRAFVERRSGCNHWAGEEPYDRERARDIEASLRSLRCARLPDDERALRRRYARRWHILDILDQADWDGAG